jgi:capsular polysaccharide biosynthesis protein
VQLPEPGVGVAAIGAALRRHRRVLAGAAGLGLLLGLLLTILRPPMYATSSQVLLQGDTQPGRANTEAKVAASTEVLSRVSARLPDHPRPGALAGVVTAARLTDDVIEITGQGRSPARAKLVTDVTTDEYLSYSRELLRHNADASVAALQPQQDQLDEQSADVQAQLSAAAKDPAQFATGEPGAAARAKVTTLQNNRDLIVQEQQSISDQMGQARQDAAKQGLNLALVGPAATPAGSAADARLKTVAATTLGLPLLAAVGIAVLRRRDARLYSPADMARAAGVEVLGEVSAPRDDLDELDLLRYRRVVARLTAWDATGGPWSSITLIHPAADAAASNAAAQVQQMLPGLATVHRVAAGGRTLPDLPDTRAVLVITLGTLTPAALASLSDACRDAGSAPYGLVAVEEDANAAQVGFRREPVDATAVH